MGGPQQQKRNTAAAQQQQRVSETTTGKGRSKCCLCSSDSSSTSSSSREKIDGRSIGSRHTTRWDTNRIRNRSWVLGGINTRTCHRHKNGKKAFRRGGDRARKSRQFPPPSPVENAMILMNTQIFVKRRPNGHGKGTRSSGLQSCEYQPILSIHTATINILLLLSN